MTKRILCKVISSVALSESIDSIRYFHRPESDYCDEKCASAGGRAGDRAGDNGDSFIYTGRLGRIKVSVDDGLTGQVLDLYV